MKIQIDETGNFGREVNQNLKPTHNEKYSDVLNNPEWHKFEAWVKSYPLTSPQVPLSVVNGELVRQIENTYKTWSILTEPEISVYVGSNAVTRAAYHIPKTIDGFAVGSEIDEEDEEDIYSALHSYRLAHGFYEKQALNELAEKSANENCTNKMSVFTGYCDGFIAGYNANKEKIKILSDALQLIIDMNRQQGIDQYGDADKAESWSCVKTARKALECLILPSTPKN